MHTQLIALVVQPDEPVDDAPRSALSEGDVAILLGLAIVITGVFSFDMARTWWETNSWRREARRRRRELL